MPQFKQPASMYDLAVPVLAASIRNECDAILSLHDNDVTSDAFKDCIESLNRRLKTEIPAKILDSVRRLRNLVVFVYFDVTSFDVQEKISKSSPIHRHVVANVFPRLGNVTFMNLSKVDCTLSLYEAVGAHCPNLETIVVTKCGYEMSDAQEFNVGLMCLSPCKRLRAIRSAWKIPMSEGFLSSMEYCTTAFLLVQLPALTEFCWSVAPVLIVDGMTERTYRIARLFVGDELFTCAEQLRWLDEHCPYVRDVHCDLDNDDESDAVFGGLLASELRIDTLKLSPQVPEFGGAWKQFVFAKGMYLQELYLRHWEIYASQTTGLTYDDVRYISSCCPELRRLTLKKDWLIPTDFAPPRKQTERLFPKLEYLYVSVRPLYGAAVASLLDGLPHLETLHCRFRSGTSRAFLDTLARLRNTFSRLVEVKVAVCCESDVTDLSPSDFLAQFLAYATTWPNLRTIVVHVFGEAADITATAYVEGAKNRLKEENVDLTLAVKFKGGHYFDGVSSHDDDTAYCDSDMSDEDDGDESTSGDGASENSSSDKSTSDDSASVDDFSVLVNCGSDDGGGDTAGVGRASDTNGSVRSRSVSSVSVVSSDSNLSSTSSESVDRRPAVRCGTSRKGCLFR